MNADQSPWIREAAVLFPDLLELIKADPARKRTIDDVLDFFPRDADKVTFLRFAHKMQMTPDDPALVTMVQLLSMLLYLNQERMEPAMRDIQSTAANVTESLRSVNEDTKKYARVMAKNSQDSVASATGLTTALAELKVLIGSLGSTLDEATSKRLEVFVKEWSHHVDTATSEMMKAKAEPMVQAALAGQTEAIQEDLKTTAERAKELGQIVVQIRDHFKPAVDAVNETTKMLPIIDKWVKIPTRDFRNAVLGAIAGGALSFALGWDLHKPEPYFTATPQVIDALTAGADYLAIREKLDAATRKKVDDAIRTYIAP